MIDRIWLVHEAGEGETGYWAECLEQPGLVTQGETLDELRRSIKELVTEVPSHEFITWSALTIPFSDTWTAVEGYHNEPAH